MLKILFLLKFFLLNILPIIILLIFFYEFLKKFKLIKEKLNSFYILLKEKKLLKEYKKSFVTVLLLGLNTFFIGINFFDIRITFLIILSLIYLIILENYEKIEELLNKKKNVYLYLIWLGLSFNIIVNIINIISKIYKK